MLYVNHGRKRQRLQAEQTGIATPKNELHPMKIMLNVWRGFKGIIHCEILSAGCTVTADLYCQQLNRAAAKLRGKHDGIYYLHDNA